MTSFIRVLTSMTLNGLKPPKSVVLVFFAIFDCVAHIHSDLRRNGWRQSRTIAAKAVARFMNFAQITCKTHDEQAHVALTCSYSVFYYSLIYSLTPPTFHYLKFKV